MEVLCACDLSYVPHTATMLCSLLEHNGSVRVHLFYDTATRETLPKLMRFVQGYGAEIECYEITSRDLPDELRVDRWVSIATYYRLLAPRILRASQEKVLYLDSDLIVRNSLRPLWSTELNGLALAAVRNFDRSLGATLGLPADAGYFNAGVMLMNLQYWRENAVSEKAVEFIRKNPVSVNYWDQDALNVILRGRWRELPSIWNEQGPRARMWHSAGVPAIVHFCGAEKPWHLALEHDFKRDYQKYRRKTPWWPYELEGRPDLLGRIRRSLQSGVRAISPRSLARTALPIGLRLWLQSLLVSGRARS
jgi:lipopolysaccharide biosynthesis glycosyltransferase